MTVTESNWEYSFRYRAHAQAPWRRWHHDDFDMQGLLSAESAICDYDRDGYECAAMQRRRVERHEWVDCEEADA